MVTNEMLWVGVWGFGPDRVRMLRVALFHPLAPPEVGPEREGKNGEDKDGEGKFHEKAVLSSQFPLQSTPTAFEETACGECDAQVVRPIERRG